MTGLTPGEIITGTPWSPFDRHRTRDVLVKCPHQRVATAFTPLQDCELFLMHVARVRGCRDQVPRGVECLTERPCIA